MAAQRFLVLDLDNTLIYAKPHIDPGITDENNFSFRVLPSRNFYRVKVRKYARQFLRTMIEKGYKLIIWSAGSEYYVKCIVAELFKDIDYQYVLTFNHLTDERVKVLSTIREVMKGVDLSQVRLLDDNRIHQPGQEEHFVYINPFKGEQDDDLLQAIDDIENSYTS